VKRSPRPYQTAAVEAIMRGILTPVSGLVVIPTGGGKTLVMKMAAQRVKAMGGVTLTLSHRTELQQQAAAEGLNALTIQAFYLAEKIPWVDVLFIDEAHMIADGQFQQYRAVIAGLRVLNPAMRVVGFTATPSRFPDIPLEGNTFGRTWFKVSKEHLLKNGWLTPLVIKQCTPRIIMQSKRRKNDYSRADLLRMSTNSGRRSGRTWSRSTRHPKGARRSWRRSNGTVGAS